MAQRILITACLSMTAACLAVTGLGWQQSNKAGRAAAEGNHRLEELIAQTQTANQATLADLLAKSRSTNEEILKQLQAMGKPTPSTQAEKGVAVGFKLTQESLEGPPVSECEVQLGEFRRRSDDTGLVDFGVVPPGDWVFSIRRYWDDRDRSFFVTGNLAIDPGNEVVKSIICPKAPPDLMPTRVLVQWPADLADKNLRIHAMFVYAGLTYQSDLKWMQTAGNSLISEEHKQEILCGPMSKLAQIVDLRQFYLWQTVHENDSTDVSPVAERYERKHTYADVRTEGVLWGLDAVKLEPGSYRLVRLSILRPRDLKSASLAGERFDFLCHAVANYVFMPIVYQQIEPPDELNIPTRGISTARRRMLPSDRIADDVLAPAYWGQVRGRFEIAAGKSNEWTIPLPDELVGVVREKLKRYAIPGSQ